MTGFHFKSLALGIITAAGVLAFLALLLHSVASGSNVMQTGSTPCPTPSTQKPQTPALKQHKRSTEYINAEDDLPLRQANLLDISDKELHHRQYFEHVKSFRSNPLLHSKKWGDPANPDEWKIQTHSRPWENQEREVPCENEEATTLNIKGVKAARAAYDDPDVFPPNFVEPKELLKKAIEADKKCLSAKLNLYIILVGEVVGDIGVPHSHAVQQQWQALRDDMQADSDTFEAAGHRNGKKKLLAAKFFWFIGILDELINNRTSETPVTLAMKLDPGLVEEHLHPSRRWMRTALGASGKDSDFYLRKGLAMLLAYYEYTPFFGGAPPVEYADTQRFLREWRYQTWYGASHYTLLVMQRAYQTIFDHKMMGTGRKTIAAQESSGDPINTWMNVRLTETADRLAGAKMVSTYGFTAMYNESMYLSPHTDQPQCEMTFTILVSAYPSAAYCPIYYMRKPPRRIDQTWGGNFEKEGLDYYMSAEGSTNTKRQLGELSVIRGRAMTHFSPPTRKNVKCITVLSHFVPEDKSQYEKSDPIGIE